MLKEEGTVLSSSSLFIGLSTPFGIPAAKSAYYISALSKKERRQGRGKFWRRKWNGEWYT